MRRMMKGSVRVLILLMATMVHGQALPAEYQTIPGLPVKDRVLLAGSLVEQGQCREGLIEIAEAMTELPNNETLLRLKAICEVDLSLPEAKDTIMKWLKVAPQDHPERSKMLALWVKSRGAGDTSGEWILVPAGEFEMGAEGDPAEPDEAPKHKVTLDAFYIGKYEITNGRYHTFVKAAGHRLPENDDPKFTIWQGNTVPDGIAETPVVNVSWHDAAAYCKWAGGRLPTEAEWEKAARGTDGRTYPWGNEPVTGNRANYGIVGVTFWEGPSTLGKKDMYDFGKSPYGAYEMAGNVWEWVQDWYNEEYYKTSPAKDPAGPSEGQARVMRGGSWREKPDKLRSANRNKLDPDERRLFIGIRCAKDAK